MKKILCLFTGGTIGSVKIDTDNGPVLMQPSEAIRRGIVDSKSILLDCFFDKYKNYDISRIDYKNVMEELSENMILSKIDCLIKSFKNIDFELYDGIIVTHGTDTLAYTSSIMSYVLAGVTKPVVFVSSNYTLTDSKANGVINMKSAIDFIDNVGYPGVFVSYSFNNENKIIYGSRISQCLPIVDDFPYISSQSPFMQPLGVMTNNGEYIVRDYELDSILQSQSRNLKYLKSISKLSTDVMKIDPYTGLNYDVFNLNNISTILHTCYHSGTACCANIRANNIKEFIKRAQKYNIDFYFGPIYGKVTRDIYSSTEDICNSKSDIIMNMTPEAAYAKLIIANTLFDKKNEKDKFIYQNINNEYIYGENIDFSRKR